MTEPTTTPPAVPETPSQSVPAAPAPQAVQPSGQPVTAGRSAAHPADGSTPQRRGIIGWLNFYAEDLLAPISKPGRTCERCKRKMWRGYLLSAPTRGVKGVSDMQIVCWRCKLSAAQQEMARLRTTGRR